MAIIKYKDPVTEDYISVKTKTLDTLPVGTEVDFDGNSVPSGWEEVNDPSVYSTTEQRIGTWVNGKPLYRKVISFTLTNGLVQNIAHNISNVAFIYIKDFFCWKQSSGLSRAYNYFYNSSTNYAQVSKTEFMYLLTSNQDPTDSVGYVILEYTKTTD